MSALRPASRARQKFIRLFLVVAGLVSAPARAENQTWCQPARLGGKVCYDFRGPGRDEVSLEDAAGKRTSIYTGTLKRVTAYPYQPSSGNWIADAHDKGKNRVPMDLPARIAAMPGLAKKHGVFTAFESDQGFYLFDDHGHLSKPLNLPFEPVDWAPHDSGHPDLEINGRLYSAIFVRGATPSPENGTQKATLVLVDDETLEPIPMGEVTTLPNGWRHQGPENLLKVDPKQGTLDYVLAGGFQASFPTANLPGPSRPETGVVRTSRLGDPVSRRVSSGDPTPIRRYLEAPSPADSAQPGAALSDNFKMFMATAQDPHVGTLFEFHGAGRDRVFSIRPGAAPRLLYQGTVETLASSSFSLPNPNAYEIDRNLLPSRVRSVDYFYRGFGVPAGKGPVVFGTPEGTHLVGETGKLTTLDFPLGSEVRFSGEAEAAKVDGRESRFLTIKRGDRSATEVVFYDRESGQASTLELPNKGGSRWYEAHTGKRGLLRIESGEVGANSIVTDTRRDILTVRSEDLVVTDPLPSTHPMRAGAPGAPGEPVHARIQADPGHGLHYRFPSGAEASLIVGDHELPSQLHYRANPQSPWKMIHAGRLDSAPPPESGTLPAEVFPVVASSEPGQLAFGFEPVSSRIRASWLVLDEKGQSALGRMNLPLGGNGKRYAYWQGFEPRVRFREVHLQGHAWMVMEQWSQESPPYKSAVPEIKDGAVHFVDPARPQDAKLLFRFESPAALEPEAVTVSVDGMLRFRGESQHDIDLRKYIPRIEAPAPPSPVAATPMHLATPPPTPPVPVPPKPASYIGQDRLTTNIDGAIISHLDRPDNIKPLTIYLSGGPGDGKSMFGDQLGERHFGARDAVAQIDLGVASNESEGGHILTNLLGAPRGFLGSDKVGEFERALNKVGPRGVIVFNHADRLGLGKMEVKQRSFEQLASIIRSGKFDSIATGKSYPLANYVFLFNGNEAADLYRGTQSEKKIQELYAAAAKPTATRELLEKSGIPPEFLQVIGEAQITRPLPLAEKAQVVHQILDQLVTELRTRYPAAHVTIPDSFSASVAELLVTQEDGMKTIERLVDTKLRSALIRAIKAAPGGAARLELGFRDTFVDTHDPLYSPDPFERRIFFQVRGEGGPLEQELTDEIPTTRLLGLSSSRRALDNPAMLAVMQRLPERIGGQLIGQDEAVQSIVDGIQSYFMKREGRTRPLSYFFVGTTGTGKTELGKATARAVYGSEENLAILSLGGLSKPDALDELMGEGTGKSATRALEKKKSEFELAIEKLHGRGVLILDEASNMGGNNLEHKDAMFKKFYPILDEGKWKSPDTGITYDFSNIIVLYTGNDAEKLFHGNNADDIRLAIWEANKDRATLSKLLRELGIPEAFLGRIEHLMLSKPLTTAEMERITRTKFLEPYMKQFHEEYPGIKVSYGDDFVRDFTKTFFTQGEGARSMRTVVEQRMGAALTGAILEYQRDPALLARLRAGSEFKLEFKDNLGNRRYAGKGSRDRRVTLSVAMKDGPEPKVRDMTPYAPKNELPNAEVIREYSFHEAGHAVTNRQDVTGERVDFITIFGKDGYGGYVRWKDETYPISDRARVKALIGRAMAGQVASMMAGLPQTMGWSSDLENIKWYATRHLIQHGGAPGLTTVRLDKEGVPQMTPKQQAIFDREINLLLKESFDETRARLEGNWDRVRATAGDLLRNGVVSRNRFEEIMTDPEATLSSRGTLTRPDAKGRVYQVGKGVKGNGFRKFYYQQVEYTALFPSDTFKRTGLFRRVLRALCGSGAMMGELDALK